MQLQETRVKCGDIAAFQQPHRHRNTDSLSPLVLNPATPWLIRMRQNTEKTTGKPSVQRIILNANTHTHTHTH